MRNSAQNLFPFFGFLVFVGICHGAPELAPTLDAKLNGTNSVVYCPTLQIAWDGLAGIVGGPIQMQQQDDLAQELNSSSCPSNVVPEQAHVAMAGYAKQGFVADLKNALHEKFGEKAPELPSIFSDEQTEIITYSYLSRTLPFPKKFVRSKTRPLEFRCGTETHPVHCFGATRRNAQSESDSLPSIHSLPTTRLALKLPALFSRHWKQLSL